MDDQTTIPAKELPLCFSCDKFPQKYITGLCEECHKVAVECDKWIDENEGKHKESKES